MAKAFSSLCIPLSIRPTLTLHRRRVCYMVADSSSYTLEGCTLAVARKQEEDSIKVKAVSTDFGEINMQKSSDDTQILIDNNENEIKMQVAVSGTRTQVIFDDVFSKMVKAAQPIPGFRRIKGGRTPDIPKEILLHILGPEKVKKQTIKKIINVMVSEYAAKEGLKVSKNLHVVESYEELEVSFQPGKMFIFNAILQL